LLNEEKAKMLSKYLTAINISMHHYSEFLNDKIYGTHVSLNRIKTAIKVFNEAGVKVRVNCNLVKGVLDNKSDTETMIEFVSSIGADEIRFSELQNAEDQYVDASKIFDNITSNPFCDGCEQLLIGYPIKVRVKITCGIVSGYADPKPIRMYYRTPPLTPDGYASIKHYRRLYLAAEATTSQTLTVTPYTDDVAAPAVSFTVTDESGVRPLRSPLNARGRSLGLEFESSGSNQELTISEVTLTYVPPSMR
jgi:hypothetical protein